MGSSPEPSWVSTMRVPVPRGDVVEPEAAAVVEEEMFGVGGPDVGGHAVAGAVVGVFFVDGGGGEFAELLGGGEDAGVAGGGVDLDDVAGFAGGVVVGGDEGEEFAVGAPFRAVRGGAGEVFVGVGDGADSGIRGGWGLGGCLGEGRSCDEAEDESRAQDGWHVGTSLQGDRCGKCLPGGFFMC